MIVIHSFEEAHQLWQQGQLPFRLLQEQAMVLLGITQPERHIENAFDIADSDIEWLLQQEVATDKYEDYLGGNFKICQDADLDLQEIQFENGFDIDEPLAEGSGQALWWYLVLCTNNNGGTSYLIPKHLWQAAQMAEHVALWNAEK